jgi:hypothetical protein
MLVNDATTFGGCFDMRASSGPFRIVLKITVGEIPAHNPLAAEFEYRPPGSR